MLIRLYTYKVTSLVLRPYCKWGGGGGGGGGGIVFSPKRTSFVNVVSISSKNRCSE